MNEFYAHLLALTLVGWVALLAITFAAWWASGSLILLGLMLVQAAGIGGTLGLIATAPNVAKPDSPKAPPR